jgi:hypothetical protein
MKRTIVWVILVLLFFFSCLSQYQNARDAMIGGIYGETLTHSKRIQMERDINNAIAKLKKTKRFTWSTGLDYTLVADYSWYPTQGGGSSGLYKLNQQMFNQMKRSWFTDVIIGSGSDTVYVLNVDLDSSVVGYSLFIGYGDEKYIREHKNDKIDTTSIRSLSFIDSSNSFHILTREESARYEKERAQRKIEHQKEIARRTFWVVKFINKHTIIIDRKCLVKYDEIDSEIKPPDFIEGLCNCSYGW